MTRIYFYKGGCTCSRLGMSEWGGFLTDLGKESLMHFVPAMVQRLALKGVKYPSGEQIVQEIHQHERPLTEEEKKYILVQIEELKKNEEFNRAMKLAQLGELKRMTDNRLSPPKEDKTPMFILGGMILLGLCFTRMKKM